MSSKRAETLVELQHRLGLCTAVLRQVAAGCLACGGGGAVGELWEVFLFEDDPRIVRGHLPAPVRQRRGRLEQFPRTAGRLVRPCRACRDIRQVIETAGAPL